MKNEKLNFKFSLAICLIIITLLIQWIRLNYGVDVTDESFLVSESYSVIKGFVPVADIWSQTPLTTILIAPFVFLYNLLVGGTEGIILYIFRVNFIFKLLICLFIYLTLKKSILKEASLVFSLLLFNISPLNGRALDYNTLSLYLLFFSCILLAVSLQSENLKKVTFYNLLAGILMALAAIAHTIQVLNCIILAILIMILEKRKIKNIPVWLIYTLAGIIVALAVTISLYFSSGESFINGFSNMFKYNYFKIPKSSIVENTVLFISLCLICFLSWKLCYYISNKVANHKLFKDNHNDANNLNLKLLSMIIATIAFAVVSTMLMYVLNFLFYDTSLIAYFSLIPNYIALAISLTAILYLKFLNKYKQTAINLLILVGVPSILNCFFIGLLSPSSVISRMYIFYPVAFLTVAFSFLAIAEISESDTSIAIRKAFSISKYILVIVLIFAILSGQYLYVYRDERIPQLTYKVSSGVYKGLYTTPVRGKTLENLEKELKQKLTSQDDVIFADLMPAAYMMTDANILAPTAWDPPMYRYGFQDDDHYQRFFAYKNKFPTKIVFINSENRALSIDDPNSDFAKFVKANYTLEHQSDTEVFGYRIFTKNN